MGIKVIDKIKKVIDKIKKENPVKKLNFSIDILPEAYARPRFSKKLAMSPNSKTAFYNPKSSYKRKIIKEVQAKLPNDFEIIAGEIKLKIVANIVMPQTISKSKTKQELSKLGIINPLTRPDVDNYGKIILDALNKIIYLDDSQVYELTCIKKYTETTPSLDIFIEYRQNPIKLR